MTLALQGVRSYSARSPALRAPFTKHDPDLIEQKVEENLRAIQQRTFEKHVSDPENLQHFKSVPNHGRQRCWRVRRVGSENVTVHF